MTDGLYALAFWAVVAAGAGGVAWLSYRLTELAIDRLLAGEGESR